VARLTRAESQAQTRSELLVAAARVFARRGYSGASIGEIAEEAGFSHGAVYSNFESKEDLFLAVYEHWVAERVSEIEAVWSKGGSLVERARAATVEWVEHFRRDPRAFLLRLEFAVRGAHEPELRQELGTRVGAVPLAIRRLLEDALRREGLPVSGGEQLALALQALSIGLALEGLSNPDAVSPALAGDLAAGLVESFTARAASERR
jgi:AcrR family transcriptional regulator